ncbi:hypothetical protein V8G54_013101 [Vigna mungo]|uniref:Uncharacterized protein n=1 Tax=Vigna mungo TaxID=3915 RepID=A0AAQ3NUF0_VIGMU
MATLNLEFAFHLYQTNTQIKSEIPCLFIDNCYSEWPSSSIFVFITPHAEKHGQHLKQKNEPFLGHQPPVHPLISHSNHKPNITSVHLKPPTKELNPLKNRRTERKSQTNHTTRIEILNP